MYVIYPDSNALYRDPYWSSPKVQALRDFGDLIDVEVWFSPVVKAELERQRKLDLETVKRQASEAGRKFAKQTNDKRVRDTYAAYIASVEQASSDVAGSIYDRDWATVLGWPTPTAQELVERELAVTPPFSQAGRPSEGEIAKGYRDTMIWLGLLDAMVANPSHTFVFVTNDAKGFLADDEFHPALMQELRDRGIEPENLQHFRDIPEMAKALEPLLDFSLPREVAVGMLIGKWAEDDSETDIVGRWDEAHEVSTGLEIDFETGYPIEGELGQWNFDVTETRPADDGNPSHWIACGTVYFNWPVYKADYYMTDEEPSGPGDTYLVDEINSHYFLVGFERPIEVLLEIDTSSSAPVAVTPLSGRVIHD